MDNKNITLENSRRDFLKKMGLGAVAITGLTMIPDLSEASPLILPPGADAGAASSLKLRMMEDIKRAMQKPIEQRKWGMIIDMKKCFGCYACTVGCAVENGLPPGMMYRPVSDKIVGNYPSLTREYIAKPCQHCEIPSCVKVCPAEATRKREDGIVVIDYDKCIGCESCVPACPYESRKLDDGKFFNEKHQPYEDKAMFEYKIKRDRKDKSAPPVEKVRKCHFCIHRIEKGQLPMCTSTCIGHATFFGDLNDSSSLVAELTAKNATTLITLKKETGNNPTVKYIN